MRQVDLPQETPSVLRMGKPQERASDKNMQVILTWNVQDRASIKMLQVTMARIFSRVVTLLLWSCHTGILFIFANNLQKWGQFRSRDECRFDLQEMQYTLLVSGHLPVW